MKNPSDVKGRNEGDRPVSERQVGMRADRNVPSLAKSAQANVNSEMT